MLPGPGPSGMLRPAGVAPCYHPDGPSQPLCLQLVAACLSWCHHPPHPQGAWTTQRRGSTWHWHAPTCSDAPRRHPEPRRSARTPLPRVPPTPQGVESEAPVPLTILSVAADKRRRVKGTAGVAGVPGVPAIWQPCCGRLPAVTPGSVRPAQAGCCVPCMRFDGATGHVAPQLCAREAHWQPLQRSQRRSQQQVESGHRGSQ